MGLDMHSVSRLLLISFLAPPKRSHISTTLNIENRKNISRIALSPSGALLISVDEGTLRFMQLSSTF
jgi:hypothetical protein